MYWKPDRSYEIVRAYALPLSPRPISIFCDARDALVATAKRCARQRAAFVVVYSYTQNVDFFQSNLSTERRNNLNR